MKYLLIGFLFTTGSVLGMGFILCVCWCFDKFDRIMDKFLKEKKI